MQKKIEWIIAALIFVLALVFTAFKGKDSGEVKAETQDKTAKEDQDEPEDEAEKARRRIMAEMGAKGGKKSKRGPAKKKLTEDGI
jgi:hypothetical protein